MSVDLNKLVRSIDHMIHHTKEAEDLSKKEIQQQIRDLYKEALKPKEARADNTELIQKMGEILDLTKNPGTNLVMKAVYFIFQGTRRDARTMAAHIILHEKMRGEKKNKFGEFSYDMCWKKITEMLKKDSWGEEETSLDDAETNLLKALLVAYKPHGLNKKDLEELNGDFITRLYELTGELNLHNVSAETLNTDGFLADLMTKALEKKDLNMAKAIFAATKKMTVQGSDGDFSNRRKKVQLALIDIILNGEGGEEISTLKGQVSGETDHRKKINKAMDYLTQCIKARNQDEV